VSEPIEESKAIEGRGGPREGSGAKPDWFKNRCRELACHWRFFEFAERVFEGAPVEPRTTSTGGIIFTEASVAHKVYLWEKLANYGFGKPVSYAPGDPRRSVQHAEAALAVLKLMQEAARNGVKPRPNNGSESHSVGNGRSEPYINGSAA
jgi:hypothetical protein